VTLQFGQVVERVGSVQLARMDQAHKQVAHCGTVQSLVEERVLTVQNRFLQCPLDDVMPTPGLCRAETLWMLRSGRISDARDRKTRHNHRPSKKARSESVGRKRTGTAPDGAACASAFSLSCMSAWR